jgi:transcriptional regulator with XRE-family HTH domain
MKPDELFLQAQRHAYRAGVSLNKLCGHAGVSYSTLWRMKNGIHEVKPETLEKLRQSADELEKLNPFK